MADPNDQLRSLIDGAHAFLRQQQELYGDEVWTEPETILLPQTSPLTSASPQKATGGHEERKTEMRTPTPTQPDLLTADHPAEPWVLAETLDGLHSLIHTCIKCPLGHTRKNFVFGVGNPNAEVVVIGEAPGADEDEQGEPFVGRAGQLLNKILEAVQFKREEVYICNILKCRPPGNRKPTPEEVALCEPYLWRQLEIANPKMILALGLTAAQALLKTNSSLGQLRGKFFDYRGIKLMVTYHPAALLRNPNWKRPTWEDVQLFRKTYDEMQGSASS